MDPSIPKTLWAAQITESDIQVLRGDFNSSIVQVGKEAASTWKVGDRVGILNFKNARGSGGGCTGSHKSGRLQAQRVFCRMYGCDSATTVALPDTATVWGAINKARPFIRPADTIGVVGIGGLLGQLGLQFAKALEYRTVAIDKRDSSLRLMNDKPSKLRPDLLVNSTHGNANEEITKQTAGEGLAVVLRGSYVASREEVREMMEAVSEHGIRSQLTVVERDDIPRIPETYSSRAFRGRRLFALSQGALTQSMELNGNVVTFNTPFQ
ncbi:uncharacterized protein BDW43DRAFT_298553 [Aspergillus alliaceus]|uniref:uncharacterized protein n=1 Tax=Petromyces alliaceus TaxID=209559 RepID=UPI0012A6EC0D|nr:uncharacterized protein BDW43DRAFT_298553 [Aspergillus alliaceus]KAB8235968.1 hypothetical protein BDW43DRAFT_298553 [Aspergillus alliaceus]